MKEIRQGKTDENRIIRKKVAERIGSVGILFALLAGATTEQYGVFTCIVLWGMSIMHYVWVKERIGKDFLLPVIAAIGYLTVLLVPGTWLRVGNESSGLLALLNPTVLCSRFQKMSNFITGTNGCLSLLVLFCLVSASLVFAGNHYSKLLMIGYPAALTFSAIKNKGCFIQIWR